MKTHQSTEVLLLALMLTAASTVESEQTAQQQGKAIVRSIDGKATYSTEGGTALLKTNMELPAGVTITTGPESVVYLSLNGLASTLVIQPNTTISLTVMNRFGVERDWNSETRLDLKAGTIVGHVAKASGKSTLEITTPYGVTSVQGRPFEISVDQEPYAKL
jgi:hypothetical protein